MPLKAQLTKKSRRLCVWAFPPSIAPDNGLSKRAWRTHSRNGGGQGHAKSWMANRKAFLVALACSTPPRGRKRWTMQLLADRLVALQLVEAVSDETVRRVLKKTISSRGNAKNGAFPA